MKALSNYDKFRKFFTESDFWEKIQKVARKAGIKISYAALLLYYVLRSPATPSSDRMKIIGALGYFILPVDLIPDYLPVIGFSDDLAALTWALYSVAKNITPEVKVQAQEQLGKWFKDYLPSDIEGLF
ncbi:MAG: DUF1232 domain-containing protein [Bacteroidales bacterium]|nr:DUF1232 domain-containing protein [Bacteroidales bacterium]